MRKFLLLLMIIFYPLISKADTVKVNSLKKYAFNAPDEISENINKLTKYLVKPFDNDYDKLAVIAYWISSHIAYDSYVYDNDKVYAKNAKLKYDILEAKAGICNDFAQLFYNMANIAKIKDVKIVSGYVVDTDKKLRKLSEYKQSKMDGHAWNEVNLDGHRFYVDTTFMAKQTIGHSNKEHKSSLKHKLEINKRGRTKTEVNQNINLFYFDFNSEKEIKQYGKMHFRTKYEK